MKIKGRRRWQVWCKHCEVHHLHGPGEGHREAHCNDMASRWVDKLAGRDHIVPVMEVQLQRQTALGDSVVPSLPDLTGLKLVRVFCYQEDEKSIASRLKALLPPVKIEFVNPPLPQPDDDD